MSEPAATFAHPDRVACLAFSPDGTRLARGGWDHAVRIRDLETGEETTLRGPADQAVGPLPLRKSVFCDGLVFLPGGTPLVTGSSDGVCRVWDPAAGRVLRTLGETVRDRVSWTPRGEVRVHARPGTTRLALSADGGRLVTGGRDADPRIWDTGAWEERGTLSGHGAIVDRVAAAAGADLLATASWDETVRLWTWSGDPRGTLEAEGTRSLALSPPGDRLALGRTDGVLRLVDPTGDELLRLRPERGPVTALTFSPTGDLLATGGRSRTVRLVDPETGETARELEGSPAPVEALAYGPAGERLAVARGSEVELWELSPDPGRGRG